MTAIPKVPNATVAILLVADTDPAEEAGGAGGRKTGWMVSSPLGVVVATGVSTGAEVVVTTGGEVAATGAEVTATGGEVGTGAADGTSKSVARHPKPSDPTGKLRHASRLTS